jgi:hypothetical protein
MGKRSYFAHHDRDYYRTPYEAVAPLIPHLTGTTFDEPCVGDGALRDHLESFGLTCKGQSDIEPRCAALALDALMIENCLGVQFITNPPWSRDILHALILHLSDIAPTWLLFDADWMHTKQAIPFLRRCSKIVSIGRVKWIAGSKYTGKDNCAWYLFESAAAAITFVPRNNN